MLNLSDKTSRVPVINFQIKYWTKKIFKRFGLGKLFPNLKGQAVLDPY